MNEDDGSLLERARKRFHARLKTRALVTIDGKASNADSSSSKSVKVANRVAELIGTDTGDRIPGQTAGAEFETACLEFLRETFLSLRHIVPGEWGVDFSGPNGIAQFEQYAHLSEIEALVNEQKALKIALGGDYVIKPDVVVYRRKLSDLRINENGNVVDDQWGIRSSLRERSGPLPILHASVSCKWTLRSDRAQNTRSEALNLIRNRKGRLPHIVVVTAEPMVSRISSIALGTGDIDCVYHFGLHELRSAITTEAPKDLSQLDLLLEGKRLRDISDLPLDLAL